jgi:hypothetical protein
LTWSWANALLVACIVDPSGGESASGVKSSGLLYRESSEDGKLRRRNRPHRFIRQVVSSVLERVRVSAMSKILGDKTAPGDLAGNGDGSTLTPNWIATQDERGMLDTPEVERGRVDFGGLA